MNDIDFGTVSVDVDDFTELDRYNANVSNQANFDRADVIIALVEVDDYIYANAEEQEEAEIGMAFIKQRAEREAVIMNSDFDYEKYHNHEIEVDFGVL